MLWYGYLKESAQSTRQLHGRPDRHWFSKHSTIESDLLSILFTKSYSVSTKSSEPRLIHQTRRANAQIKLYRQLSMMQTITISLTTFVVLSVLLALFCILSIVALVRWRLHIKTSNKHHEIDEISFGCAVEENGFYARIGIIGQESTIDKFMQYRGMGEGRSQSRFGPYDIIYNPSPWQKNVHAAVFLHDANPSVMILWKIAKRPVAYVGQDPVRQLWYSSNWVMCLTSPFDQLLERIHNGCAVPELRV